MHLGKSSKIILFIVEGITDEISLGLILSKIIEKDKAVRFKVVGGDITSQNGVNTSNILTKITKVINEFIEKDIYRKSDILKVVHLVDIDGTFISDDLILEKDVENIEYTTENIYAKNIEKIKARNKQKSQILNKLATSSTVYTNLPYEVYFFSCNLEHVLHNELNVADDVKEKYAYKFADKYVGNPSDFIDFINNPEFALTGQHKETWEFIRKGANSLNRYTNFNLYIESLK